MESSPVLSSSPPIEVPLANTSRSVTAIVPSSSIEPTLHRSRPVILVSQSAYSLCWCFVLVIHVFVAAFDMFAGFSHLAMSLPVVHAATSALGISVALERLSGASYVIVGMLHVRASIQMISRSVHRKRLVLGHLESISRRQSNPSSASRSRVLRKLYHEPLELWHKTFGSDGYFGIYGPHFSTYFAVREAIEIVLQTYQALSLSRSVSRPWINQFAVATVVLNCWSSVFVRNFYSRGTHGDRHLLHLVVDMYLDLVFGLILPVCVLLPYALAYDWSIGGYPPSLLMDDVWLSNAVAEGRQVLVTSYLDYCSSMLPQFGIISCLLLLKKLVRRSKPSPTFPSIPTRHSTAVVPAVAPSTTSSVTKESCAVRAMSVCIAVWGIVVLGLHVRAQAFSHVHFEGCSLQMRPWFVSNFSCAVAVLNCARRGISGSVSEVEAILSQLYRPVLARIVFAHCPALHIPPLITKFHGIYVVDIQSSTLVDWPASALVSQAAHPYLMVVSFVNSNVSAVPPALVHSQLPRQFVSIEFFNCSLAELPDDIGDAWSGSSINTLALERTHVRRLPSSLGRVRWKKLWLAGSNIDELPETLLANSSLKALWLSGNPLSRLPEHGGDTSQLTELYVEDTNVSSLPSWVNNWLTSQARRWDKISFSGSPVCKHATSALLAETCDRDLQTKHGEAAYDVIAAKYPL